MSTFILFIMAAKVASYKIYHHFQLTRGQLITKRRHAVAALGDMLIDLVVGLEFEVAVAQVWYLFAVVERFSLTLGSVTHRAVLAKQRRLVRTARRNVVPDRF